VLSICFKCSLHDIPALRTSDYPGVLFSPFTYNFRSTFQGASSKAADLVVDEIKKAGGDAVANYDSVTDGDKIIKTAIEKFGRVDILINNAYVGRTDLLV
jgi:hypothetical protein